MKRFVMVFVLLAGFGVVACGGGGGGGSDPLNLGTVTAFYPTNGADWLDYVVNDGAGGDVLLASDTAASGTETGGYDALIHGGEMRAVAVSGADDCTGLTAQDVLSAFNWTCHADSTRVLMISTGLAGDVGLTDLIDFTGPSWKTNAVSLYRDGNLQDTTAAEVWWGNPVMEAMSGAGVVLTTSGAVYTVGADREARYIVMNHNSVALVVDPSAAIIGTYSGETVLVDNSDFFWFEGNISNTTADEAFYLTNSNFPVFINVDTQLDNWYGIAMSESSNGMIRGLSVGGGWAAMELTYSSENNTVEDVTVDDCFRVLYIGTASHENTVTNVSGTVTSNGGIAVNYSDNNTLDNVDLTGTGIDAGISINGGQDNFLNNIEVDNFVAGISLSNGAAGNQIENFRIANSGNAGLQLTGAHDNILASGIVSGSGLRGISLVFGSYNNRLSNITVAATVEEGLNLADASDNALINMTVANSTRFGIYMAYGTNNLFMNVASVNNSRGLQAGYTNTIPGAVADNITYAGLAVLDNTMQAIYLDESSDNYFTGPLMVAAGNPCYVWSGSEPGIDHDTCLPSGGSDAVLSSGVSATASFSGKVIVDDSVNLSDTNGAALFDSITDWTGFDNEFRAWGLDGAAFASTTHQGRAYSGDDCRIWDWSLDAADTALLDANTVPGASDSMVHTWSDMSSTKVLRNAVEIFDDDKGNDDGLCEADEDCVFTPNVGSYQGHGTLQFLTQVSLAAGDIDLYEYTANGR